MTIEVVSSRVDSLAKDLSRVEKTVDGMDAKIDGLGLSLLLLARLEERQQGIAAALALNAATMVTTDRRISVIETKLPGLVEMRTWVISGLLAGVGMIGLALAKLLGFT